MDPELKAFLQESFESIDRRFESIDRRFDAIDQRFDAIDQRFDGVDRRLDAMDQRFEKLEETVRYTQITVEALESKVELVAEGVVGANERIDALRKETKDDHADLRSLMVVSVSDLGQRVRLLEERKPTRVVSRRKS